MYLIKLQQKAAIMLSEMAGKTFTVGKVTATGNGAGKWLILQPKAVAAAGSKGTVILKVEGGKQLMGLTGKTFTVGKAPLMAGKAGAGKWLALQPVAAAAKAAAVGTGGASAILTAAPAKGAMATKGYGRNQRRNGRQDCRGNRRCRQDRRIDWHNLVRNRHEPGSGPWLGRHGTGYFGRRCSSRRLLPAQEKQTGRHR